jgi:meiotic recombination protein REC8
MSTTYLARMTEERQNTLVKKAARQAKKDPLHWILGGGINGVGSGIGRSHGKTPLSDLFSGNTLFGFVTGRTLMVHGQKRESEGYESAYAQRNVRPRLDEENQVGRGDELRTYEDGPMQVDDREMGRYASDGVGDVSNFPWNVTASIRGSSVLRGLPGSASGLPGSVVGSVGHRGSRIVSASPLHGRARLSGLESLIQTEGFESDAILGNEFGALGGTSADTEFEMYDAGANANTETEARSSFEQTVLDQYSTNFLNFIENAIDKKYANDDLAHADNNSVDLEELLPSHANSRAAAAQALLHILTLATKNLITASQLEEYGAIELRFV